jgi:3-deoxy-D-manno-octulosonic-acid transferase
MSTVPFLYRAAVRAARRSAPFIAWGDSKLARGLRGRRGALEVLERWGRWERDAARATVWFHAPSVGEGLQAGAVLAALRQRRPGLQAVFTHFSPSAEGLGERIGADVSAYLPWDVNEAAQRALDALNPGLLSFTKTEVWPVLVEEAARRGTPVALVGASLPADAGRMRWPARAGLRSTWARLSMVCAEGAGDGERFVALGAPRAAVHVTGDPGIDSAALRAQQADPAAPWLAPLEGETRPVLVAGSTWPEDEEVLLAAWERVRRSEPRPLLVVVPHEPSPDRVGAVLGRLRGLGMATVTVGEVERRGAANGLDAVVVDRVGILAHLYTVASVAYVGGGFGRDGLHSVLEPAAAGVPVLFGPRHQRSGAAGALLGAGAARVVTDSTALRAALGAWLPPSVAKVRASERASDYIDAHRGAAARTAELLDPLIKKPSS